MPGCRYGIEAKVTVNGYGRCVVVWAYTGYGDQECEYDVTTENGTPVRIRESQITGTWW